MIRAELLTSNWLGGESGYSDEGPVTSSLPPFLKEHLHLRKPLVVVFYKQAQLVLGRWALDLDDSAVSYIG